MLLRGFDRLLAVFVYQTINASDYLTISIITRHNGLLDSLWRIASSTIYCVHANLKLLSFLTFQKFTVFTLNGRENICITELNRLAVFVSAI